MDAVQLQKTLRASQYAEQVLANHQDLLNQDYAIDQFQGSLGTEQIQDLIYSNLLNISDETMWMRSSSHVSLALGRC